MIHKSSTKTGVADYFAVLGIPSFLDDDTAADDVDASNARQQYDDENADENGNEVRKENDMHLERFHREIIQLALLPSSSQHSAELNDEKFKWTICKSNSTSTSTPDASSTNNKNNNHNALHLYGASLNLSGVECESVRLAYQCRGHYQPNKQQQHQQHDVDDSDVVNSTQQTNKQHYYNPAMADAFVHYVKVHPLCIPHYTYVESTTRQQTHHHRDPHTLNDNNNNEQQKSLNKSIPNTVAHATAKTLSLFARRTLSSSEGLINAVKNVRGVTTTVVTTSHANNSSVVDVVAASTAAATIIDNRQDKNERNEVMRDAYNSEMDEFKKMGVQYNDDSFENGIHSEKDKNERNEVMRDGDISKMDEFKETVVQYTDGSFENGIMKMTNNNQQQQQQHDPGTITSKRQHFFPDTPAKATSNHAEPTTTNSNNNIHSSGNNNHNRSMVMLQTSLSEMLPLPPEYDEWIIPSFCQTIYLPTSHQLKKMRQQKLLDSSQQLSLSEGGPYYSNNTHLLPTSIGKKKGRVSPSSMGVEAMYVSPLSSPAAAAGLQELNYAIRPNTTTGEQQYFASQEIIPDPTVIPSLVPWNAVPSPFNNDATTNNNSGEHVYIPILAVRRQRIGEEERYHEDPAVVDIMLSRLDSNGQIIPPIPQHEEDDNDEDDNNKNHMTPMMQQHGMLHPNILKKSSWSSSMLHPPSKSHHPILLLRKNIPNGLADVPFAAR
eukprot:scaffold35701_cov46-Cyclotella_meneghiniana.AAC.2